MKQTIKAELSRIELSFIIKNMPSSRIEFDDWDYDDETGEDVGSYKAEDFLIEHEKFSVECDLECTERSTGTSQTYDSPAEYTSKGTHISIGLKTIYFYEDQLSFNAEQCEQIEKAIVESLDI